MWAVCSFLGFKGTSRSCSCLCGTIAIMDIWPIGRRERTHVQHHLHLPESWLKHPMRGVVDPHPCLEVRSEDPLRYPDLLQWSDHPHRFPDFTERNIPSCALPGSRSAPKPSGPTAMWVGIPKDARCWEGRRDFLDFSSHDILVRDGKGEVYRSVAPNLRTSWLAAIG